MLQLLISTWLLAVLLSSFINTKASLCLYLAYMLFVPFVQIDLPGLHLGENLVSTMILAGFLIKNWSKRKMLDFSIFKPFFFLYVFYLVMILFQRDTPMGFMLNSYRVNIMRIFILPFVLWNAYLMDRKILNAIQRTLLISVLIICLYGLFLTQMQGFNPWLMAVLPLGGSEFNEEYAFSGLDGRIFGRISSVFPHPMTNGLFLCISFVYVWAVRKWIDNKYLLIFLLGIISLDIMFCGVRSAIAGLGAGVVFYLILTRKIKLALWVVIGLYAALLVAQNIPGLSDYLGSIADIENKKGSVQGSSIDMRIEQLNGCFREIQNCFLVGKGYDWTSYYHSIKGDHPIILAFESLIYVVLCNNGFLGIIAWSIFFFMIFRMRWPVKELRYLIPTLFVTYIAYSCITGEFGYIRYTLIFYVVVLMNYMPSRIENKRITKL